MNKLLLMSILTVTATCSTSAFAFSATKGSLIESKDELYCSSFRDIDFAAEGIRREMNAPMFSGWMTGRSCGNLTEGMDLKVIRSESIGTALPGGETQGVLIKLPTGMTAWILR